MTELVFIATRSTTLEEGGGVRDRSRLPQLEWLLARAHHSPIGSDWRAWLAARLASEALRAASPAAIAGAAFRQTPPRQDAGQPESAGCWLATPVHLFAGLDSLHVHPQGLLQLDAAEQQALSSDFAGVFADSPWRLEALGQRELLLSGPALAASGADPEAFLGCDPRAGLPSGEASAGLRRLGSEIEMWLHEHALNRVRQARGQLPVTALWFWGGQPMRMPAAGAKLTRVHLYGRDTYVEALCRLQSLASSDVSSALSAIAGMQRGASSDTVVLMPDLLQLEQYYLPAALQAVRERRVSSLRVVAYGRSLRLSFARRWRFWGRPQPWWETFG